MKYIVVALLWLGFGLSHSFLISERFERWARNCLGGLYRYYRLIYNLIALGTFLPLLAYTKHLDAQQIIVLNRSLQVVLLAFSTVVLLWAFFSFDVLEFLGFRQAGFGKEKAPAGSAAGPVRRGIYGIVRHPMYSATVLFIWSLNSTWAEIVMKVCLTGYIVVGAMLEERKLVKQFGSSYVQYQNEVPMLIPFTNLRRRS